jgi:hypothetical protein
VLHPRSCRVAFLPVPGPNPLFDKDETLHEGECNISTRRVAHVSRFGHTEAAIEFNLAASTFKKNPRESGTEWSFTLSLIEGCPSVFANRWSESHIQPFAGVARREAARVLNCLRQKIVYCIH